MENGYSSWKSTLGWGLDIPHYYGDYVRTLFIATAILSLVAMPAVGYLLPPALIGTLAQVGAALVLILLAGLTSARNLLIMIVNATVAGVSVALLESFAVLLRHSDSVGLFLAREAGVLLMLGALYFAIKTIRGMMTGKLGHSDTPLEFDDVSEPVIPLHSSEMQGGEE